MTENEALELTKSLQISKDCDLVKAFDFKATVIKALEDLQQYRTIGTVEEFKALKEKNVAKKPRIIHSEVYNSIIHYYCPNCGRRLGERGEHNVILFKKELYCQGEDCGQKLDWSE